MKIKTIFFLKLFFISIPFAVFALCALLMNIAGEYSSIKSVLKNQEEDDNIIFGPAYTNPDVEYKLENVLMRKPEILVIGTSRTMQFKEASFNNSFYNAGGVIDKISQIQVLLRHLKRNEYIPRTIILGLDQYFFNSAWDTVEFDNEYEKRIYNSDISLEPNPIIILKDILKRKIKISELIISNNIGVNARINKNGFKSDGTYYYGGFIEKGIEWDKNFSDTYSRIRSGTVRFQYSNDINQKAVTEFKTIVYFCEQNNIKLICIIPPYAPSVWKRMQEANKYQYINKIYPALLASLSDTNSQFVFDFTFIESSVDSQFYDGFHGNENIYKLIAEIIHQNLDFL